MVYFNFGQIMRQCLLVIGIIRSDWIPLVRRPRKTSFTVATGKPEQISELVNLNADVGDVLVEVRLTITRYLTFPILMSIAYQNRYIEAIHFKQKLIEPVYNRS